MTKLYTLRELADQHGFPFEATRRCTSKFTCTGISPADMALGWNTEGQTQAWPAGVPVWNIAPKQRTLTEFLIECPGPDTLSVWGESKAEIEKRFYDVKILKTLRTEVIEETT